MGQTPGKLTPLQCLLNHFKDFRKRAQGYGASVTPFDLQRFCQLDWPTLGVGWPSEGSFDLQMAFRVRGIVYGNPGHPDQAPYLDVWIDIMSDAPKYLKTCQSTVSSIMAAVPTSPPQKPPVLLAPPEDPPELAIPPPYPRPNVSGFGAHGELSSPPHTRTGLQYQPPPDSTTSLVPVLAPLKEVMPPGDTTPMMLYVPFTTSDLYNWKLQTPPHPFSEKLQGLTSLLETIFFTHQPTWDDCQQSLQVLFTTEEKGRTLEEGRKHVLEPTGQSTTDPVRMQLVFSSTRPDWDPNTTQDKEALQRYRQLLLQGLRAAAHHPINLSKP
ncbi:uncharacterized protein LOC120606070 isoform X2 [Pteropus medius]|uniref:uncharacterized protein LOC120606070 isoform X2 n=1 Tax=Pteropus vampyrus TaxID=132908 RepID=UPI00196AF3E1|nr:uncharacterized protein LOC120606070 isoform X2 [Pteropus giganteus]